MAEHRYEKKDLENISAQWAEQLKNALNHIPDEWMDVTFDKISEKINSNMHEV
jgi:putative proteasome-type protease